MAETSVGEIGLDLVVNQNQFNKQMNGITGLAKKAGAALAAAFAVKKIVAFGKECLELGSDLAEVQNVVDVTFPSMTAQVDKFAKSAAMTFGLSETMAKKISGTFGAMAKSFGFSESAAYDMSSALTGLAGDVASFYNISQDEAYTKLKSVFTGETESLKDLGVVMTQTALDTYAMANGFGKTTQEMTEAEKVSLRYRFVMSKLSSAQGDFARTADSWANQTRILKLQLDSIKATLGQGFINLFTPIIKSVNSLLGKIATLANAFKSFTELITGKKSSGQSVLTDMSEDVGASMENASGAADGLNESTNNIAKSAQKAVKEMRALMGFDKINKLDSQIDAGQEDDIKGDAAPGENALGSPVDFGSLAQGETVIEKQSKLFDSLIKKAKELAGLFKKGFEIGFGDSETKIQSIKDHLEGIGNTLKNIFSSQEVLASLDNLSNTIVENFGKVAGAMASIGLTIADNLIGGIDLYLSQSKDYIKAKLVSIFNVSAEISNLVGNFITALSEVFSVFRGDTAKQCTADFIGIFADAFWGALDLALKFGRDIIKLITDPFVNNADAIKTAIENTLQPIGRVLSTLREAVQHTFEKIAEIYDTHVKPFIDSLTEGITSVVNKLLEGYNMYIAPVLDRLAEKFRVVWEESIQPTIDKAIELFGHVIELLKAIWENVLKPFVDWLVKNIMPVIGPIIEGVGTLALDLWSTIFKAFGGILDILTGFVDFLTGVFSGDTDKAMKGLEEIVSGFKTVVDSIFSFIQKHVLQPFSDFLSGVFSKDWTENFGDFGNVLNTFFNDVESIWNDIKRVFTGIINFIKGVFTSDWNLAWNGIKDIFGGVFNGLISLAKAPLNAVIGIVNSLFSKLNYGLSEIESAFSFSYDFTNPITGNRHYGHYGLSLPRIPEIPELAQGGWVEKNTPQLAVVGDNRHQGEVVAPENKLKEMAMEAARSAGSGISRVELEQIINDAVMRIVSALGSMAFIIDSEVIARAVLAGIASIDERFNPVVFT